MKVNSAKEIGLKVSDIIGIDIFKNTRKREYVEGRALVVYLLRKKLCDTILFTLKFLLIK